MSSLPWRHSLRALLLTADGAVLLGKHRTPRGSVWAAPGGDVESGESGLDALQRELREEIGWELSGEEPAHVWRQEILDSTIAPGFQGVVNDYYLVRIDRFEHRGDLAPEALQAEGLEGFAWWSAEAMRLHSDELFSPHDLATLLPTITRDTPPNPVLLTA